MTFKTVLNLVLTSRNVNQGPVIFVVHYTAWKWSTTPLSTGGLASRRGFLIQEIQFEDGNKTVAGLDFYKTEQELAIPYSGCQFCYPGYVITLVNQSQFQKGKYAIKDTCSVVILEVQFMKDLCIMVHKLTNSSGDR